MSVWCPDCGFDDWGYEHPVRRGTTCPECGDRKLVSNVLFADPVPSWAGLPPLDVRRRESAAILETVERLAA